MKAITLRAREVIWKGAMDAYLGVMTDLSR